MVFLKKSHTLPAVFAIFILNFNPLNAFAFQQAGSDSTIIEHRIDGLVNEWPASGFSMEDDTKIRFMADHDSLNLYIVVSVPDRALQMKMSRMGMKLFIDLKGKKKEGMGIEFPIKKDSPGFSMQPGSGINPQEEMKRAMIMAMIQLKLFGFGEEEPFAQQLELPGSAHIATDWDTSGTLNIEYRVPLNLLGKKSSLDQKTISLGWRINSVEVSSTSTPPTIGTATTSTRGRPTSPRNSKINQAEIDRIMKEQKFWTKYTFN